MATFGYYPLLLATPTITQTMNKQTNLNCRICEKSECAYPFHQSHIQIQIEEVGCVVSLPLLHWVHALGCPLLPCTLTVTHYLAAPTGYLGLLLATPVPTLYLQPSIPLLGYFWLLLVTPVTTLCPNSIPLLGSYWVLLATPATTLYLQPYISFLGYFWLHFGHSGYYPVPSNILCGSSYNQTIKWSNNQTMSNNITLNSWECQTVHSSRPSISTMVRVSITFFNLRFGTLNLHLSLFSTFLTMLFYLFRGNLGLGRWAKFLLPSFSLWW